MIRLEIFAENRKIPINNINEIVIFLDDSGIDELCGKLKGLRASEGPDHLHLSIFGCGDIDLDANISGLEKSTLISQVRIVKL